MTVEVYRDGYMPIRLSLPTRLAGRLLASRWFSRLLLQTLSEQQKQGGPPPSPWPLPDERQLQRLFSGLGHSLCRYRGLTLLEVHSAAGDRVTITL